MKILEVTQGSVEWLLARSGIPTASEFDNLLTPKWKVKTGEGPKTYVCKKIAETWQGGPLPSFSGAQMEQGSILEEEAVPWFELEFGVKVNRVGFITTDDGLIGCSPDGLIGEDGGIEIKCPEAHTHVGYVMDGVLPDEYLAQVHGSMFVTGRSWWKFVSYRRGFPQLVMTIHRDEEIQAKIAEALAMFRLQFDSGMDSLTKINGGPPRRMTPYIPKAQFPRAEKFHVDPTEIPT